ncbi:MAG: phosphate butyryltransferase [Bacteroidales bacterium]|nr:phosphate butyryltransferase [Bacteroidales bacterium]NPV35854.1 phosphate butyryltransferase [Bacteroidales bacterium]
MITHLEQMIEAARAKTRKRIVAAYANDSHTIEAVNHAIDLGIVEGTLVGDEATIMNVCRELNIDPGKFKIIQEADEQKAARKAVELIVNGEGDILMKGLVSTDKYMRAILNKEAGLMPPKAILSHVTVVENPNYHKLLIVGDVAIIPAPDLDQKIAITNYLIQTAHALGNEKPKVALIAATEQMLPGMQACVDAGIISKMAERGQIKGAIIDGPLSLDTAIDKESAEIKKLKSEVAGDADCLLFPNIEAGNVFYKFNTKLAKGELGAIVVGAKCPAVLSSRGDSALTKTYSIALAALVAK